ncbi:unnamed protein product [Prorocentrum cordatum]|uniref:Uncharacterized protein n=1 Tax=Prorocentrum cordatum TaxID=2364126 RepID=A0ABN9X254_9DINO|nr:unnamed protein product [Polarella glacialis]
MLRPVSSESWPSNVGPPSIASFRVAFRGSCRLPPDVLTRSAVTLALPAGVEQRRRSSPDGDGAAALGGWGPPVRLKVTRVSLSRSRREDRQSRSHSRERGAPSPPVRGHGGPVAVAPQRGRLAQAAPAPTAMGVPQSWRESVDTGARTRASRAAAARGASAASRSEPQSTALLAPSAPRPWLPLTRARASAASEPGAPQGLPGPSPAQSGPAAEDPLES